uniref:SJCHGC03773 protein n=1 Tax=Schistosoma japonicum TaxID=6182 RepID=Q5BSM5_SCHJA|nr:SJCHGC03773 protein [Schistosoma japonicum]
MKLHFPLCQLSTVWCSQLSPLAVCGQCCGCRAALETVLWVQEDFYQPKTPLGGQ